MRYCSPVTTGGALSPLPNQATCPLSLQRRSWSTNSSKASRWRTGGMSKASARPFCSAPARQREARLDGSGGVGLLSAHSTPERRRWWRRRRCKRCSTPIGNLIHALLPAVILMLQGKIARQVSPFPSILTFIIGGNYTHVVLQQDSTDPLSRENVDV